VDKRIEMLDALDDALREILDLPQRRRCKTAEAAEGRLIGGPKDFLPGLRAGGWGKLSIIRSSPMHHVPVTIAPAAARDLWRAVPEAPALLDPHR